MNLFHMYSSIGKCIFISFYIISMRQQYILPSDFNAFLYFSIFHPLVQGCLENMAGLKKSKAAMPALLCHMLTRFQNVGAKSSKTGYISSLPMIIHNARVTLLKYDKPE